MTTVGYFPDDDEDKPGEQETISNTSFQELRTHARQLEKQLKASTKELEDLRVFRTQAEANEKLSKARGFGLTEPQAKAFLKMTEGVEVTPEAVQQFRIDLGLAASETPETETPTSPFTGFSPLSAGGTFPVKNVLSYQQYQDLLKLDPTSAFKAVAENRVEGLAASPDPGNPDGAVAKTY